MDSTTAIVFHAFLQNHTPNREALLYYLPEVEIKHLNAFEPTQADPSLGFPPVHETLSTIHYSWLAPFLRTLPESDIALFLSCLNAPQIEGLTSSLRFSNTLPPLSFLSAEYLKKTLFEQIAPSTLLPLTCLPQNPLNELLIFTLSEWNLLIDLMSMHDLSIEIFHIIETVKLQRIYEILSPPQSNYLKTLSYKKEPVTFKKMGLTSWNGDPEAFKQSLFQRGMNRIAKALYGHEPNLLWYLSHHLEIEKGNTLIKLCAPLDHPQAASILSRQVIDVISFIHPHTPV